MTPALDTPRRFGRVAARLPGSMFSRDSASGRDPKEDAIRTLENSDAEIDEAQNWAQPDPHEPLQ